MSFNPVSSGRHVEDPARSIGHRFANLGPRQREIADIVYSNLSVTPRYVQEQLSEARSLRVVRTLLDRMVSKGLVKRRPSGRHRGLLYVAAVATPGVKEAAVEKLVNEQFGGSVHQAIAFTEELAKRQQSLDNEAPRTVTAVRRAINARR